MIHRIARLSALAATVSIYFVLVGCQSSGSNVNSAANSNTNVGNANIKRDSTKEDAQEVSHLLDQYNDALLKLDAAALERIWVDDLSFVNPRGELLTKKERVENIKTGATAVKTADVSDKQVRMYGQTAVATLVVKIAGQYSGQEGDGSFRVTTVWAKPKGHWQMVSTQMTPMVK